ncbi:MAG: hypothetical protein JWM33_2363 [Caulobacteraceae bacterium]|nr:hypothetical protein [Caulobacteraceae bacterium]
MKRALAIVAVGLAAISAAPIKAQTAGGWPYNLTSGAAVAQCDLDAALKPVDCKLTFEEPANSGLGDYVLARALQGWDRDRLSSPPGKLVVAETVDEWAPDPNKDTLVDRPRASKPPPTPKAVGGAMVRCDARPDRTLDCKVVDEWPAKGLGMAEAALADMAGTQVARGVTLTAPIYQEYEHAPDHRFVQAKWAVPPDDVGLKATRPIEAARKQIGGDVLLHCHIDAQGLVKQCWVGKESPTGYGFGQAALSYSRTFRFKPFTVDGKPYASTVSVPVRYDPEGEPAFADTMSAMVAHPHWRQVPSPQQVQAAWPAGRKEASFLINLRCQVQPDGHLTKCNPIPTPPTIGAFLTAARNLAAQFQTAPLPNPLPDPKRLTLIDLPILLVPPGATGEPLTQLDWSASPAPQDYIGAIKGLTLTDPKPLAIFNCLIGPAGELTDCQPVAQSDDGLAAALVPLTAKFQAELWSNAGRPTAGERVNLPIGP